MTVKELIEKLQFMDPDSDVILRVLYGEDCIANVEIRIPATDVIMDKMTFGTETIIDGVYK